MTQSSPDGTLSLTDFLARLDEVRAVVSSRLSTARAQAGDIAALESSALGKRSELATLKSELARLSPDERRPAGQALNEATESLRAELDAMHDERARHERHERIRAERMDLTEVVFRSAVGRTNLITQTREALEDVFLGMGFTIAEGPEVETDWYNFEALNIPPSHPARAMFDTFYLDIADTSAGCVADSSQYLLRTHTSPVQIHVMQECAPPIYSIMPGRVYRRDTPDARHTPTFHQIEGLVVDKGISFAHLAGTIEEFTTAYFGPAIHSRLRPSYFPFTEPSAEYEITCTICEGEGCRTCSDTGWIELGGCGMVDPLVFEAVGLDPEEWTGFAFGFGIDRCAQMRHAVSDMRVLPANDVRFIAQF